MAYPPSSVAGTDARPPSSLPNGVRAPPTITDPAAIARLLRLVRCCGQSGTGCTWQAGSMTAAAVREVPGLLAIDHVGIAVPDLDAAIAFHTSVLGLVLLHREENVEQGVAEAMLAPPDGVTGAQLQLLAPLSEQSTLARFLERSGPGLQQLAFRVEDIDHAASVLRGKGLRLLYDAARTGTGGSRINFVHPKDTGGVLIELVQAAVGRRAYGGRTLMTSSDNTGLGLFDDAASAAGNFPSALRGYDRAAVDDYVRSLEATHGPGPAAGRRRSRARSATSGVSSRRAGTTTTSTTPTWAVVPRRSCGSPRSRRGRSWTGPPTTPSTCARRLAARPTRPATRPPARATSSSPAGWPRSTRSGPGSRPTEPPTSTGPRPSPRPCWRPVGDRPSRCVARPSTMCRRFASRPIWTPRSCAAPSSGRSPTPGSRSRSSARRR